MRASSTAAPGPAHRLSVRVRSVGQMTTTQWLAIDDAHPQRRIAFGTEEAAVRFVAGVPGWSALSADDPRTGPITGLVDDPAQPVTRATPSQP